MSPGQSGSDNYFRVAKHPEGGLPSQYKRVYRYLSGWIQSAALLSCGMHIAFFSILSELQNLWIRSREQRCTKPHSVYRWSNTVSKHLEGTGWRIIRDDFIPILVRGPKNSVLLHPGD